MQRNEENLIGQKNKLMKTTKEGAIIIKTETLKSAICEDDIAFLQSNIDSYNINARFEDEDNDTLLLFAIGISQNKSYKFFLQNGADVYATNAQNENILHAIVYSGDINRLNFIIKQGYKLNIDEKTMDGATPLLISIALRESNMAKVLINNGADVNIPDNEGLTPLHIACQEGDIELAKVLIEKGANIRSKTAKGNYPIMLAIANDHEELSKMLFQKHFSVS